MASSARFNIAALLENEDYAPAIDPRVLVANNARRTVQRDPTISDSAMEENPALGDQQKSVSQVRHQVQATGDEIEEV
jgi:hypothetical protein